MSIHQLFPIEDPPAPTKNVNGPAFEDFWATYPRRCAKKDAIKAWSKLRAADRALAIEALPAHVALWRTRYGADRAFIPYPASWLNGARWEDELDPVVVKGASGQAEEVQWWVSWSGIIEKGAQFGLKQFKGERDLDFKVRILAAAGPGPWRDAQRSGLVAGFQPTVVAARWQA